MAVRVLMPKGSDTMTEGKVLKWLKAEGETVSADSAIVEIETEKVNMEVEATGDGVVRKILVPAGQTVPVGQIMAIVGAPDEDISGLWASGGSVPNASLTTAATSTPLASEASSAPITTSVPASLGGELSLTGSEKILPEAPVKSERVIASPLARRIAREKGIDLSRVAGRGPGGRIMGGDVERATLSQFDSPPASVSPTQAGQALPERNFSAAGPDFRDESLSSMRKTIANRVIQSLGPVPHFYLTIEVDMRRAKELREASVYLDPQLKLTYNDIIVKACAVALRQHPEVNASFLGDRIRFYNRIHIGIAVAVDGGGPVMPIVRDCDKKTLQQISKESKELVARIKARKLSPEEYAGATFSVSNLGMMGIDEFSAVINPPEGAILAVGKVLEKAVVSDGLVRIGQRCRMTLSCDHRLMDGATGAKFLHTLRGILESNPGNQPVGRYATI